MQQALIDEPTASASSQAAEARDEPVVGLEIDLPERVAVGRGNAFVVGGYCYQPGDRIVALHLDVGGERTPVERFGLPRLDVYERAAGEAGEEAAFHSGFVATARLSPRERPDVLDVGLLMTLASGAQAVASVGRLRVDSEIGSPPQTAPPFPAPAGSRVAICMATYDPPQELLRRQLASIREQTHQNWICLISDDGSRPESFEALVEEVAGDERFLISRNESRLGFYQNFERALAMVPPAADYVALCDQDDRWRDDKIERLIEQMGAGVELAYSDARVVNPEGTMLHPSYWTARRNNYTNLGSLLIANTVTGAASLFRRELLEDLLPFPPPLGEPFHDHWLSLVALARGRINYVGTPLYDYVQHTDAVIGHSGANRRPVPVRERLRDRLRNPGDGSRVVYFYRWYQQKLFAEVLRIRSWEAMTPPKRRALRRFLSIDSSARGMAWLLGRRLRRLGGRNETLDIERVFAKVMLRQRAVSLMARGRPRPRRWLRRDASIPPAPREEDPW